MNAYFRSRPDPSVKPFIDKELWVNVSKTFLIYKMIECLIYFYIYFCIYHQVYYIYESRRYFIFRLFELFRPFLVIQINVNVRNSTNNIRPGFYEDWSDVMIIDKLHQVEGQIITTLFSFYFYLYLYWWVLYMSKTKDSNEELSFLRDSKGKPGKIEPPPETPLMRDSSYRESELDDLDLDSKLDFSLMGSKLSDLPGYTEHSDEN